MFYVYVHRRRDNDDPFYVGKGSRRRAWDKHGRNPFWQNVTNKYGHTVEILGEFDSEELALLAEVEVTATLREMDYRLANIADGGGGISGLKHSDEVKQVICIASKKLWEREDHRKRHAEAMSALWMSEAFRDKHAKSIRRMWEEGGPRRYKGSENVRSKPVVCVETGRTFDCMADAVRWLRENGFPKAHQSSISLAASPNGRCKRAYGYAWAFVSKDH